VDIAGQQVTFPDSLSPDQLTAAVRAAAQQMAPGNLDRRTGAPAGVRAAAGAAPTAADRLATVRNSYPDARPFGDDNIVFTDPRTGRPTLYNPPGLDWGDVASIGPEIGELAGGAVGAALAAPPAIAGIPATGGASLLAVPAGAGLGAAAGREMVTLTAQAANDTQDSRGPGQRLLDAAMTAGTNAAAGPLGEMAVRGVRAVAGPVRRLMGPPTGAAARNDFVNAGVTPSAGAVTGNRAMQLLEGMLEATPGGAGPMAAMRERQAAELGQSVGRVAQSYGAPGDPSRVGGVLREGAEAATQRFEERQRDLYERAFALIPGHTRVPLPSVAQVGQTALAELRQAPESRAPVLQPVLNRIEAMLADAGPDGLRFEAVRRVRTDLGRLLGEPRNSAQAPPSATREYLERLYSAVSDDMHAAVSNPAYPWRENALRLADRYTRFNRTQNMPALERVLDAKTDERVFNMAFPQNGKPDVQELARLRRNLQPGEWNALASTVLDRMGMPTAGANAGESFSVNTFLTNWNKLHQNGEGARNVLFSGPGTGELATEMDRFVRVAQRLRDAERMRNYSGTARVGMLGAGTLAAGQDVAQGDWQGLATTAALGIVAPRYAAQLMTDPRFIRWLTSATPQIASRPQVADRALARLVAVGEANPELRDAIEAYRTTFIGQSTPPPR
jgi:hypothetical protein